MVKRFTYFIAAVLFFAGLFWLLSRPPKNNSQTTSSDIFPEVTDSSDDSDLIFYWGDGCPHCENVEDWLNQNNSDGRLKVTYREVYSNQENREELYNTAEEYCPEIIKNGSIGVPTGFDPVDHKCIQGDTPIIDFLSAKLAK